MSHDLIKQPISCSHLHSVSHKSHKKKLLAFPFRTELLFYYSSWQKLCSLLCWFKWHVLFYMLFDSQCHYHHNNVKRMLSDVLNWTSLFFVPVIPEIYRQERKYTVYSETDGISHKILFKIAFSNSICCIKQYACMHAPKSQLLTYSWCFIEIIHV